jgi:putative transposase
MTLTYKYRLKGKRSARILRRHAWAVNQTWNFCAQAQRAAQRHRRNGGRGRWPTYFDLSALAAGSSEALGIDATSILAVCRRFAQSRDAHRAAPRFRASGGPRRSLGWVPFRGRRPRAIAGNSTVYRGVSFRWFKGGRAIPGVVTSGAFIEDASGRWWVAFNVEVDNDRPTGAGQIGIDLGLKHLAVMSDGEKVESLRTYRAWEGKLATAQRAGNRARARAIHRHVRNIRQDHLHKTSARLAAANRLIAVGNVRGAGKSVLDAGWSTFRNQLEYKARRHRAVYVEVNEAFTTQTCSRCGDCSSPGRPRGIAGLGIREWECSSCGAIHDRDVNAATNILAIALSDERRADGSRAAHGRQPDSRDYPLGSERRP